MATYWKITVENDDGTTSEYFVDQTVPLSVGANEVVEKFTAFQGGLDIYDDVVTPNWYVQFFCFLWAIKKLNPNWEVGRLLGAGIETTKTLVGGAAIESTAGNDIFITVPQTYFPDGEHESFRRHDFIAFTLAGNDYRTKLDDATLVGSNIVFQLDPDQPMDGPGWAVPLAHPIASTPLDSFTIEYRKLPQYDENPIFFMDEPEDEQTQRFIQQIYDLMKTHLFAGDVDYRWLIGQTRFDRLIQFLDRVKAVETNYVLCSELPSVDEFYPPAVEETTPTDATTSFLTFPAVLVIDQDYIETYLWG